MKVVINSILYLFGMGSNPLSEHKSRVPNQSDYDAISSDWRNVGMDIFTAIGKYETEQARG